MVFDNSATKDYIQSLKQQPGAGKALPPRRQVGMSGGRTNSQVARQERENLTKQFQGIDKERRAKINEAFLSNIKNGRQHERFKKAMQTH